MKNFIVFCYLLLLVSCRPTSHVEKIITQEESFWVIIPYIKSDSLEYLLFFCDKYDISGKMKEYYIDEENSILSVNYLDFFNNNWKYNTKDSILSLGGVDYQVLEYSKDTIFLLERMSFIKNDKKIFIMYNINKNNKYTIE